MWLIGLMYLIGFIKNIRSHKAIRSHKIKNINLSQRRQPFLPFYLFTFLPLKVPFYLFTFKTAGSSRRFRVLLVLMLKAVMLQAEQPVVLRLDRQQVWA